MMIKIKTYAAIICMVGLNFKLSAAESKYSLKELEKWAQQMNAVSEARGATVQVHAASLEERLKEIKKEAQELEALKEAIDSEEKYSVFLKKRDQWKKHYEYCKAQAQIRENFDNNHEDHLFLIPFLKCGAIPSDDHMKVMKAYLAGYLTFEVKKQ